MATILLINFLLGEKITKDNHWLGYLGGIKIEFGEDSLSVKRIAGYER